MKLVPIRSPFILGTYTELFLKELYNNIIRNIKQYFLETDIYSLSAEDGGTVVYSLKYYFW